MTSQFELGNFGFA